MKSQKTPDGSSSAGSYAKYMKANALGKAGEQLAVKYLEDEGYLIVERNYRAGKHEIDIIAHKENELVVVEVKTRTDNDVIEPEEAVDHRKRQSLIWAANSYVQEKEISEQVRFDIIAIITKDEKTEIRHIKDAFNVLNY